MTASPECFDPLVGTRPVRSRPVAVLATLAMTLAACMAFEARVARANIDCTPERQWTWDGEVRDPDHSQPCVSPLVVQLTDDDGDTFIDENDTPDVVFTHRALDTGDGSEARITAVDGLTGIEHFTAIHSSGLYPTGLAAADIDGDTLVELLAMEDSGQRLVAFENDGAFKWTSDPVSVRFSRFDTIAVADLDQDGSVEIISNGVVFGAGGQLLWEGTEGRGVQFLGSVCHAVDLAPGEPGLEVLAGDTLYDASGGIIWHAGGISDGWTAVADFEGDGDPDIAHVTIGDLNLLDQAGNLLTTEYSFGATPSSQPVAADLDGDGVAELFLMQEDEVRALEFVSGNWTLMWSQATEDPSRINGATAFDFDGDGALDIIYHDMVRWYIFDGPTGDILHQEPFPSATGIETPVLADIDNDCLTEILVSGCAGALGDPYVNEVRAHECSPAARARPMWNQYAYHVDNVQDDGTIPVFEQPSWLDHNSWIGQVSTAVGAIATAGAESPLRACAGDTVPLDGSTSTGCTVGYEYRVSEGTVPVCGWSPNPVCEVVPTASPSSYTLHVRCTGEPCEDFTEIVVELDPVPAASAPTPLRVCAGETALLDGSLSTGCPGGIEYRFTEGPAVLCDWSPSATCETTPTASPSTYTLQVRCAGTPCEDQTDILVEIDPMPVAAALTPLRTCEGGSVLLDGSSSTGCPGGFEYRFTEGTAIVCDWSSSPECEATPTGSPSTYTMDVRCAGTSCADQAEIQVVLDPRPLADAGPTQNLCTGSATQVGGNPTASGGAGGYAYLWESSPPGGIAAGEETLSNPSTNALDVPTQFSVTVTDGAGCAETASVLVDVYVPDPPLSLGNTLRVTKDPFQEEVLLSWSTGDPDTVAFRLHRGWPPAPSYPVLGPDVMEPMYNDSGALYDGGSYAYLVSGVNCAGVEGP